jgi:hypothetical protein
MSMRIWVLEILTGLASLLLLIGLLIILPGLFAPGLAYIAAIVVFILALAGVGYAINQKII